MRRSVLALELAAGLVCLAVLPAISARGAEPQAGGVPSRIVQGQALFERRCARCHGMGGDGSEGVAPPLFNVVGHEVAGQPSYIYSDAMKRKGGVWTDKDLDAYLADPQQVVPGNEMDAMAPDPDERQAIITYLKTLK